MGKKLLIIFLLLFCCACSLKLREAGSLPVSKDEPDLESAVLGFDFSAEGFTETKSVANGQRIQDIYENGGDVLVAEVVLYGEDAFYNTKEIETLVIGKQEVRICEAQEKNLLEGDLNRYVYTPNVGDWIIEWEDEQIVYRLFGNVSKEILLNAAEQWLKRVN